MEHHEGGLRGGLADPRKEFLSLFGARIEELVQDAVAVEYAPELVRACRPLVAYHLDLFEDGTVGFGPIVEELGDHPVEVLVARLLRLVDVVVDVAEGHRPKNRILRRPVAPLDEKSPPGVWEELASLGEELGTGNIGHPLVGEDQGHPLAGRLQVPEPLYGPHGRRLADHPVLGLVASAKPVIEPEERLGPRVDREYHG